MKRVYFIKPIGMAGPIKIGCSCSPEARRSALDTWSPFALEIVAEVEGDHDLERRFHALLFDHRDRREWFHPTSKVLAVVEQVRAGTFDFSSLPDPRHLPVGKGRRTGPQSAEQRKQMSYWTRARYAKNRTGYSCPVNVAGVVRRGDPEELRQVDAYLADPVAHGVSPEEQQRRINEWRQQMLADYPQLATTAFGLAA